MGRLFFTNKLKRYCMNLLFPLYLSLKFENLITAGIAQLVERNLAKVDVAGSSPVSRSNNPRKWIFFFKGAVAKRSKAKVCKTFIRGFESHRRLKKPEDISSGFLFLKIITRLVKRAAYLLYLILPFKFCFCGQLNRNFY